jgi:hypothetical protein
MHISQAMLIAEASASHLWPRYFQLDAIEIVARIGEIGTRGCSRDIASTVGAGDRLCLKMRITTKARG